MSEDKRLRIKITIPNDSIAFLMRGGERISCTNDAIVTIRVEESVGNDNGEAHWWIDTYWDD